ncbi:MAG TPA: hypothetical protein VE360_14135, partial [Pyrinomonadaceae bacterium]|nr:hypothetical protein [Pyrinomonadaceae bacterium]
MMLPRALAPVVLLLSLGLAPAAARDDYRRLTALDAAHYLIRLELEEAGEEIGAEAEITFAANSDVREVPLDFGELTVDAVTVDGSAAVSKHGGGKLVVAL